MENLKELRIVKEVDVFKVIAIKDITEASYILRLSRNELEFKPGQHLVVGLPGTDDGREYSIFSGIHDKYIEILIREVEDGHLSQKLRIVKPGDELKINGPYGFFMFNIMPPEYKKLVFIASGTGIAPFHSYVKSYPNADYRMIHGIRTIEESYGMKDYKAERYFSCTSGDTRGNFFGRLTAYLQSAEFEKDVMFYFCGNNKMILDSMSILQERGFSHSQMYTEVYF